MVVGLCGAGPRGITACPGKTPGPVRQIGRMQPLKSEDLESHAVTKRAARGQKDLVEQVAGLRTLAAAHLDWTT